MNSSVLALPIDGDRFRLERDGETIRVVRLADATAVGSITIESSEDGLFIRSLCIHEANRSYGAGSEAARLFNQACDAATVPLVRTWAAPNLGLSVYFWTRMGFQPRHGQGPEGGIWFERRRSP
jgi:hypothetical protein